MSFRRNLFAILAVPGLPFAALAAEPPAEPYHVVKTLPIGGAGRWDYITCDAKNDLLYVTRTTHLMVLNAGDGKVVADLDGLGGSHGTALVPELGRGFVSDGGKATVMVFDTKSNTALGTVSAAPDADSIIYDAASHHILVGCGDAGKVLAIADDVDPAKGQLAASLDVGGKPEFLAVDGAGHAFINVVDKNEVMEFDSKEMKQIARWSVGTAQKPTSMAIDPPHHLLFVGCRSGVLVTLDTESGKIVATDPIGKGVDATAFDDGKVLASCGDGTLWIFAEAPDGKLNLLQSLKTAQGAKTLAVNHLTHVVYLPTADFKPLVGGDPRAKPQPIEGTFKILVVAPATSDAVK